MNRANNRDIYAGDLIHIGEPPNTEPYYVITEPDLGRYCSVQNLLSGKVYIVYLGRWAVIPESRMHLPIPCKHVYPAKCDGTCKKPERRANAAV